MIKGLKLTATQWRLLSSAFSNIAQAIILFSLAAFFVPEVVGLTKDFSRLLALIYLLGGLLTLSFAVIIVQKGK